jgi:MFS family permease
MRDLGHEPVRGLSIRAHVREILKGSIEHGLGNPPVRMFIFAAPLGSGVLIWAFYALQPYLLELLDNPDAVFVAGVAAALFGLAQIAGGLTVNRVRGWFSTRTAVISIGIVVSCAAIIGIGLTGWLPVPVGFWVTLGLTVVWAGVGAVSGPVQQAYVNDVIPSSHRATVLSFLSLSGSAGGVVSQPVLGKVADVWSLSVGFIVAGVVALARLPFVLRVRSMRLDADRIPRQTADLP